jgi:hypothetical protein
MIGPGAIGYDSYNPYPIQQSPLNAIELVGDESITKNDLQQPVTLGGDTGSAINALWAQLDLNSKGNASEQQFARFPQMQSPTAITAEGAVPAPSLYGEAQAALQVLVNHFRDSIGEIGLSGNTAHAALLELLNEGLEE